MKKIVISLSVAIIAAIGMALYAADHIDAPAVGSLDTGSSVSDITDYYAFESPSNPENYVFVCNVKGLTAPAGTADISFQEEVMYEFNIDNTGDNVEDLVIQAVFRNGQVMTFGAVPAGIPGLDSKIVVGTNLVSAPITAYGSDPEIGTSNGVSVFAGPRDDPFFMDFFRFVDIVNGAGAALGLEVPAPLEGDAYPTSFRDEGMDTFSGSNVLSVVIEVPKSSLGTSTTFSSWLESKSK